MFIKNRIKALRVVGEALAETVIAAPLLPLVPPALEVVDVKLTLISVTTHLFPGKAVIQGIVHKNVIYKGIDTIVHFATEDLPFTLTADIPPALARMNVQLENPELFSDFALTNPTIINGLLAFTAITQKVLVRGRIKVAEPTQLDVVVGQTGPFVAFPRTGQTVFEFVGAAGEC